MSLYTTFRRLPIVVGLVSIMGVTLLWGCGGGGSGSIPIINCDSGGCGAGTYTGGNGNRGEDVSLSPNLNRAACAANSHVSGRTRWTVLVFMNAANNLQPDSLLNMGQIATVGTDSNVNLVVQWKQANCGTSADCGNPSFLRTRRYLVKKHTAAEVQSIKGGNTTVLDPDRLADPITNNAVSHQSDMGDYRVLQDFIKWGATNYPSDNLAVVVWDHGSGWRPILQDRSASIAKVKQIPGSRLLENQSSRAVSQDNATNNEIETTELPLAFANPPQPIDMLIFDCSLEMMAEVAYEIRNSARVYVGSEESPPGNGYPYDKWLLELKASGKNSCEVGNSIMTTFVANYPVAADITQSVVDLSQLQKTAVSLENFGQVLLTHANNEANLIRDARVQVRNYSYPDNKDLYSYAEIIRAHTSYVDLKNAAANLEAALRGSDAAVIYSSHGLSQTGSNGMAIYAPARVDYLTAYNRLALTRSAPHWAQFLQSQVL